MLPKHQAEITIPEREFWGFEDSVCAVFTGAELLLFTRSHLRVLSTSPVRTIRLRAPLFDWGSHSLQPLAAAPQNGVLLGDRDNSSSPRSVFLYRRGAGRLKKLGRVPRADALPGQYQVESAGEKFSWAADLMTYMDATLYTSYEPWRSLVTSEDPPSWKPTARHSICKVDGRTRETELSDAGEHFRLGETRFLVPRFPSARSSPRLRYCSSGRLAVAYTLEPGGQVRAFAWGES